MLTNPITDLLQQNNSHFLFISAKLISGFRKIGENIYTNYPKNDNLVNITIEIS